MVFNKKLNYPVDIICRIENNDREGIIVKENSSGIDFTIPSNRELTLTFDLKKDLGDKNEVVGIFYYLYDAHFKKRAGKFAFTDIHGEQHTNDTLLGKLTVLYFFNTGIQEPSLPLNKVVEKYADKKDIKFFAISGNAENDLRNYALKNNFKYNPVANNGGLITLFSYKSMITMPQHVIIDRKGDIVFWHLGDNHDIYRILAENIDKHLWK